MGRRTRPALNPTSMSLEGAPFAPTGDDDVVRDLAEDAADETAIDLTEHEPAPVGGSPAPKTPLSGSFASLFSRSSSTSDDEDAAPPAPGRPTSPPFWKSAHLHPQAVQLRVWKRTNGTRYSVGHCDAGVTEEEFIRIFFPVMPKVGDGAAHFSIRPIDSQGHEIGEEIPVPAIDENHTVLRQMRAATAVPVAPVQQGPNFEGLLERLFKPAEAAMTAAQIEAREARQAAAAAQAAYAAQSIEMAQRTASSIEAIADRTMREQKALYENQAQQQGSFFQNMTQMQQAQAAERERLASERIREEAERRRVEREEAEHARRREREEYDARRREAEADAAHRLKMLDAETQARMERERLTADRERLAAEQRADRQFREEEARRDARMREDEARRERERERDRVEAAAKEAERQRQHAMQLAEIRAAAERDREHRAQMLALQQAALQQTAGSPTTLITQVKDLLGAVGVQPADIMARIMGGDGPGIAEILAPMVAEAAKVAQTAVTGYAAVKQAEIKANAPVPLPAGHTPPALIETTAGAPAWTGPVEGGGSTTSPDGSAPAGSKLPPLVQREARNELKNAIQRAKDAMNGKSSDDVTALLEVKNIIDNALTTFPSIVAYMKEQGLKTALREARCPDNVIEQIASVYLPTNPMLAGISLA